MFHMFCNGFLGFFVFENQENLENHQKTYRKFKSSPDPLPRKKKRKTSPERNIPRTGPENTPRNSTRRGYVHFRCRKIVGSQTGGRVGPGHRRVGSGRLTPHRVGSGRLPPARVGRGRVRRSDGRSNGSGRDTVGSGRAGYRRVGSGRPGFRRVGSDESGQTGGQTDGRTGRAGTP